MEADGPQGEKDHIRTIDSPLLSFCDAGAEGPRAGEITNRLLQEAFQPVLDIPAASGDIRGIYRISSGQADPGDPRLADAAGVTWKRLGPLG